MTFSSGVPGPGIAEAAAAAGVGSAEALGAAFSAFSFLPIFIDRRFFRQVAHPDYGTLTYPGQPFKLSDAPEIGATAAPALGEHTEAVLSEVLGMKGAEIAGLRSRGAI